VGLYLYASIEVVELLVTLGKALWTVDWNAERTFQSTAEGQRTLPLFFNILIAMELAETMKEFHLDHRVKVVRLLSIGVIAISRKLIVADLTHGDPMVTLSRWRPGGLAGGGHPTSGPIRTGVEERGLTPYPGGCHGCGTKPCQRSLQFLCNHLAHSGHLHLQQVLDALLQGHHAAGAPTA
jgi:hypothetical protein